MQLFESRFTKILVVMSKKVLHQKHVLFLKVSVVNYRRYMRCKCSTPDCQLEEDTS